MSSGVVRYVVETYETASFTGIVFLFCIYLQLTHNVLKLVYIIHTLHTAASLNLPSGPAVASILVSKNAGRYRIQGDSYPAMLLVLEELEKRLHARILSLTGGGVR